MKNNKFSLSRLFLASSCVGVISSNVYAVHHSLNDDIKYSSGSSIKIYKNGLNKFTEAYNPHKDPQEIVLKRVNKGKDGRQRILNTSNWPHSINGMLSMTYSEGRAGGSGILIGPHHILTAGHNIYIPNTQEFAKSISVNLGLDENISPFGEIKVTQIYTFDEWAYNGNKEYDMALLVLDRSIGKEIGWSGLSVKNASKLQDKKITVSGYPGDKGKGTQLWGMPGKIKTVNSGKIFYDLDTNKGQSGSGICINKNYNPYVVGIHTNGENECGTGNYGAHLSINKFDKIVEWMSESFIIKKNNNNNVNCNNNNNVLINNNYVINNDYSIVNNNSLVITNDNFFKSFTDKEEHKKYNKKPFLNFRFLRDGDALDAIEEIEKRKDKEVPISTSYTAATNINRLGEIIEVKKKIFEENKDYILKNINSSSIEKVKSKILEKLKKKPDSELLDDIVNAFLEQAGFEKVSYGRIDKFRGVITTTKDYFENKDYKKYNKPPTSICGFEPFRVKIFGIRPFCDGDALDAIEEIEKREDKEVPISTSYTVKTNINRLDEIIEVRKDVINMVGTLRSIEETVERNKKNILFEIKKIENNQNSNRYHYLRESSSLEDIVDALLDLCPNIQSPDEKKECNNTPESMSSSNEETTIKKIGEKFSKGWECVERVFESSSQERAADAFVFSTNNFSINEE